MENNLLKNFVTLQDFREARPRMSVMSDIQVQEALNIAADLLDGICNGLISLVVQYSLSKEKKDPCDELYRTDFELDQIKKAFIFQAHYNLMLGNDFTIGSNSASTGGMNYSFQRPEGRSELSPGVKEFLARARVYEISNVGASSFAIKKESACNVLKEFLNIEDGDRRYLQKYQPNAEVGSIATIGDGKTITFTNPRNTQWNVKRAEEIVDINGDYHKLWNYPKLAFFGESVDNAISKREAYRAIWNAMWWNKNTNYPNEAIIRFYDANKKTVYTFKSNRDDNLGHNPLTDNKDDFWWSRVSSSDKVDIDELVNSVLNSKEWNKQLTNMKAEIDNTFDAFWNQIKDNEHLLKKFEELYEQTKTENDQLEQKIDGELNKINERIDALPQNLNNVAFKNKVNIFTQNQQIKGGTAFLQFNNNANVRVGYIGKASATNNDVELRADTNSLKLSAKQQIFLTPSSGYGALYDGIINQPKHITNKEYVDNAVQNVTIDTRNLAKLNEENTFEKTITTNESVYAEKALSTAGTIIGIDLVVNEAQYSQGDTKLTKDTQFAHKKYVDDAINNVSIDWSNITTPNLSIHNDKVNIAYDADKAELMVGQSKISINENGIILESDEISANDLNHNYIKPIKDTDIITYGALKESLANAVPSINWSNVVVNSQSGFLFQLDEPYITKTLFEMKNSNFKLQTPDVKLWTENRSLKMRANGTAIEFGNKTLYCGADAEIRDGTSPYITNIDSGIMTLKATKNLIQQNQYIPPKWEQWYKAINGSTAASALTISKQFTPETILDIYCYTDDGSGNHKYISVKNYVIAGSSLRINLADNILPKTPYQIWGRVIGGRR